MTAKPPEKWQKTIISSRLSEKEAKERLEEELAGLFGSVERVFSPKVRVIFKEVTYETIKDAAFQKGLAKHFPPSVQEDLFSEHDAAPESPEKKTLA